MVMPYLLGLAVAFWLVDWLEANDRAIDGLWPHSLPIVVQVLMMLLIIDFVRYWIHWSLHRFPRLWRLLGALLGVRFLAARRDGAQNHPHR